MTIEEFREIKSEIDHLVNLESGDEEQILKDYNNLIERLLSSDLSAIPYEEWEGIIIFREDLDFSKTHANLDFSIMDNVEYNTINLDGCNIKGLEYLDIEENTFSPEFRNNHPEFFPSDNLPQEIKELFYKHNLEFKHLYRFPDLLKCVNKFSFKRKDNYFYSTPSEELVNAIGFEYAMKMFEECPSFIVAITNNYGDELYQSYKNIKFYDLSAKIESYEDAKAFVYKKVVENIIRSGNYLPMTLPEDFRLMYDELFLDENVDRDLKESFDNGELSISQIRFYSKELENKNLLYGTRNSYTTKAIRKVFGSMQNYFNIVPKELDHIMYAYIHKLDYDDDMVKELSEMEPANIIEKAIQNELSNPWSVYTLEDLYYYSQFVSLEDCISNENQRELIKKVGIKNLIDFNNRHEKILDDYIDNNSQKKLFDVIASHQEKIVKELTDPSEVDDFLKKVIKEAEEIEKAFNHNSFFRINRKLSKLFPEEYLDYDLVDRLLDDLFKSEDEPEILEYKNMNVNKERIKEIKREGFVYGLERALNGDTKDLFTIINAAPSLIPIFSSKKIKFTNNNFKLKQLCDGIGQDNFLKIGSYYGPILIKLISFLDKDNIEEIINEYLYESENLTDNIEDKVFNKYFYEMIKHGERTIDIRNFPESFKKNHPELYISEDAPPELKDLFYGRKGWGDTLNLLTETALYTNPEWIPYLKDIDLSCSLHPLEIKVYDEKINKTYVNLRSMNYYEALGKMFSNEEILDITKKYGNFIPLCTNYLKINIRESKEYIYNQILDVIYNHIVNSYEIISELPREFLDRYPDIDIERGLPEGESFELLKNLFNQRVITPKDVQEHPEWIPYLVDKNIKVFTERNIYKDFLDDCLKLGLDNQRILNLYSKYGAYLPTTRLSSYPKGKEITDEELNRLIKEEIANAIYDLKRNYNEEAKEIIGIEYPELFLDENAPLELKKYFYGDQFQMSNNSLTFELLKEHKDWLPFLYDKAVALSLQKGYIRSARKGLQELFDKFGNKEALKLGMKRPDTVIQMLSIDKVDELCIWYEKTGRRFLPDFAVMSNFKIEDIDKFLAAGSIWSSLMKNNRYARTYEGRDVLVKLAYSFGCFDNDTRGYKELQNLISGIPRRLEPGYEDIMEAYRNSYLPELEAVLRSEGFEIDRDETAFGKLYKKNEDGSYTLTINPQSYPKSTQIIREYLETEPSFPLLSASKAHQYFGGFKMEYDPEFREFLLDNFDKIINNYHYLSSVSTLQRRFNEIKVVYSNVVLNLDLAISYIETNKYENVNVGNERVSQVASLQNYSQENFETIQRIYNHSKKRTFSSVPKVDKKRVELKTGTYFYEMLRLDDPRALSIGFESDCCQRLGDAGEWCMEHSMTDPNGRIFVVTNEKGEVVAQSWVWRNKDTLCFDNIEIPDQKMWDSGIPRGKEDAGIRNDFTDDVVAIYQMAAHEIIETDEKMYKRLLESGKITQEQYEGLKLGKVTAGFGYSNAKGSFVLLQRDKHIRRPLEHKVTIPLVHGVYISDSETQYILDGEDKEISYEGETLPIYHDEYIEYDDSNFTEKDLLSLERLEAITKNRADYLDTNLEKDYDREALVTELAHSYYLNPKTTRIIMTPNFAIIYDVNGDRVTIGDLLFTTKVDNEIQQIDIEEDVEVQIKLALDQISKDKEVDISRLEDNQKSMYIKATTLSEEIIDKKRGVNHAK